MRVADYIVNYFVKQGVDKCFCVTGGGAMHLNDAFGHCSDVEVVYNHHEQASAMAAEGYARVTQLPAIVSVTSGPGATNAITGVYGAWQDSIPMIVISGQMKSETTVSSTPVPVRYLGFQEADIIPLVSPITKYAATISNLTDLDYHLEKAYCLATTGRKGPVWLDIPLDLQGARIDGEFDPLNKPKFVPSIMNQVTPPSENLVREVYERIISAERPVLMLGEEVRISGGADIVQQLVSKLGIPVVTEWNAHDLIEQNDPLQCGRPGTIGDRGGNYVVQTADTLLCLGCQLSIRQISYEWKNFARKAFKIAVNVDESELQKPTINIDLPVVADVSEFIKVLLKVCEEEKKEHDIANWISWCRWINNKYPVVQQNYWDETKPINVYNFIKSLSLRTPEGSAVVLANGAACVCGLQAYEIRNNVRLFTNAGASSMGYGIAASVGAALAQPDRTTLCIEGDGSIMMNLQEIQTIVQNNLNVKIFVINNDGYHSIKQTQSNIFEADERGYCGADKNSGISFPSFEKIAKAFELPYFKIESLTTMESTLDSFFSTSSYGLCEIVTDPNQNFAPKLASKMNPDGTFYTPSLEFMSPFLSDEELAENQYKSGINQQ